MIPQHLSLTNEHFTPAHVVEAARRTLGAIDLDPASCGAANARVKATQWFSVNDDGLSKSWSGRVFLNPPGGRTPPMWKRRFDTASNATAWWRKLWEERHWVTAFVFIGFTLELLRSSQGNSDWPSAMTYPFCVPRERLCFGGDQPTHANVIIYSGPDFEAFKREFSPIGEVKP